MEDMSVAVTAIIGIIATVIGGKIVKASIPTIVDTAIRQWVDNYNNLKQEVKTLREEKFAALSEEFKELKKKCKAHQQDLAINTVTTDLKTIKETTTRIESTVNGFREEITEAKGRIEAVNDQIQTRIDGVKENLTDKIGDVDDHLRSVSRESIDHRKNAILHGGKSE